MKNKRNVLIAFILICCLCLSIGYAALTDTLYVKGTATVNVLSDDDTDPDVPTPFEEKFMQEIYWSNATSTDSLTLSRVAEKDSNITGATDTLDSTAKPDALLITVPAGVLTSEGDSTTINATVKNGSDYDIKATLSTVTNDKSGYYTITWAWATGSSENITQGATADVVITVTLTKAPITDTTATFGMTLTATATD